MLAAIRAHRALPRDAFHASTHHFMHSGYWTHPQWMVGERWFFYGEDTDLGKWLVFLLPPASLAFICILNYRNAAALHLFCRNNQKNGIVRYKSGGKRRFSDIFYENGKARMISVAIISELLAHALLND